MDGANKPLQFADQEEKEQKRGTFQNEVDKSNIFLNLALFFFGKFSAKLGWVLY